MKTDEQKEKKNLKSWISTPSSRTTVQRTIVTDGGDTITLDIRVLRGIDKAVIDAEMSADGGLGAYERKLIALSLGLSPKEVDELYRLKEMKEVDQIANVCMHVNTSKYSLDKNIVDELKN